MAGVVVVAGVRQVAVNACGNAWWQACARRARARAGTCSERGGACAAVAEDAALGIARVCYGGGIRRA